jgi:hypothetical protein
LIYHVAGSSPVNRFASAVGTGLNETVDASLFGIIMGWVITHYLVDAGTWKMRDRTVRQYHSELFAFLRT